jgi:hypothetical protein
VAFGAAISLLAVKTRCSSRTRQAIRIQNQRAYQQSGGLYLHRMRDSWRPKEWCCPRKHARTRGSLPLDLRLRSDLRLRIDLRLQMDLRLPIDFAAADGFAAPDRFCGFSSILRLQIDFTASV